MIQTNSLTKQKQTHRLIRAIFWLPGGRSGGSIVREFGMDKSTLPYLKWITNKELSTRNTAHIKCCHVTLSYDSPDKGEFGGDWIRVYVWLSSFAFYLKLSQKFSSVICCSLDPTSCPALFQLHVL